MKTYIFLFSLVVSMYSFGQTKIIALKSHSGDASALSAEKDGNFGIAPTKIDTIVRISDTCIVEINNFGWRDTVYNHPYFSKPGVTMEEIKAHYPARVIFIGFDKPVKNQKASSKLPKEKKGNLYLIALLIAGTLTYTFKHRKLLHPEIIKSKKEDKQ